jgi:hypothetical protein
MSAREYNELLDRAGHMNHREILRLIADLASIARGKGARTRRRSILELQGLGKEVWKGVEAQEYVDKERSSWNG